MNQTTLDIVFFFISRYLFIPHVDVDIGRNELAFYIHVLKAIFCSKLAYSEQVSKARTDP